MPSHATPGTGVRFLRLVKACRKRGIVFGCRTQMISAPGIRRGNSVVNSHWTAISSCTAGSASRTSLMVRESAAEQIIGIARSVSPLSAETRTRSIADKRKIPVNTECPGIGIDKDMVPGDANLPQEDVKWFCQVDIDRRLGNDRMILRKNGSGNAA